MVGLGLILILALFVENSVVPLASHSLALLVVPTQSKASDTRRKNFLIFSENYLK